MTESEYQEKIKALEADMASLKLTNLALMDRVEATLDASGSALSSFQRTILLEKMIEERTRDIETSNRLLKQEVSDRVKAERKYLLFKAAVEHAAEGIIVTNVNGVIEYANQAFLAITGYDSSKVIGVPVSAFRSEKYTKEFYESIWQSLRDGHIWKGNLESRKQDGSLLQEEDTFSPVRDKNGHVMDFVALVRDVTKEKSLEAQLRQAQKMEAIGTLAGGIAHDFNNILTPILAYTDLIVSATKEEQTSSDIRRVMDAALRAKDLVKQILTFSRQSEHERFALSPEPIVKEALKLLRATLPSTIEFRQDIQSTSEILADPTHLHQIIINLCTNAAHAMREKGGILEVSLTDSVCPECETSDISLLLDQRCIKLSVSDTGCGMDESTLSHVFEPFYTTKGVGEGTGLGLSVVHGIVKSSGGSIRVQSTPGQGTCFDLYFPVVTQRRQPSVDASKDILEGNEAILLIDDEPDIATSCSRSLERFGYRVTTRTSSIEGFEAFKVLADRFDIIVTDHTMPHRTGVQLARLIKQIRPDIPIVMMTGFSPTDNESNLSELGIDAIVLKPVVGRELANAIRNVLDKAIKS